MVFDFGLDGSAVQPCFLPCGGAAGWFQGGAKNFFHRTRLAGQFSKAQQKRIGDARGLHDKDGDGAVLRAALQDHGVERCERTRDFRKIAARRLGLFQVAMEQGGALKFQVRAGRFPFALERRYLGSAAACQKGGRAR